jgi:hypothetical protein
MENTTTTTTATPAANLYQQAAKFGIICGLATSFLVVIIYVIDPGFMASLKFLGILMVLSFGLVTYAGIAYRNTIGGYIPYGKAYVHGIVCFAVAGLVGTLFSLLLYHVIDPDLPTTMADTIIQNTEEMMANFGAPQEKIDETIAKMKDDLPNQFSAGGLVLGYGKALIWYAILALITGLIVRKNEPVEM